MKDKQPERFARQQLLTSLDNHNQALLKRQPQQPTPFFFTTITLQRPVTDDNPAPLKDLNPTHVKDNNLSAEKTRQPFTEDNIPNPPSKTTSVTSLKRQLPLASFEEQT